MDYYEGGKRDNEKIIIKNEQKTGLANFSLFPVVLFLKAMQIRAEMITRLSGRFLDLFSYLTVPPTS